jgi:hypothetical protein
LAVLLSIAIIKLSLRRRSRFRLSWFRDTSFGCGLTGPL